LRRIGRAAPHDTYNDLQDHHSPTVNDSIRAAHIRPRARPYPELLDTPDTPTMRRQVASS
jgi:hypothetical protein